MDFNIVNLAFILLLLDINSIYKSHGALVELEKLDIDLSGRQDIPNESECPSNRIEAVDAGRQCSRRCRQDSPCENIRKQCLCDGLCGLSCIKPDLVCPDLPKIDHGQFSPTSTLFNTIVRYQCDEGYFLYGSQARKCQGDEEWSGIPAECSRERRYIVKSNTKKFYLVLVNSNRFKFSYMFDSDTS